MTPGHAILITGFGRSGTTFLARMMDRSAVWTVRHEPRGTGDVRWADPDALRWVFTPGYGEVNSALRNVIECLPHARRGIILRDPLDVMASVMNRKPRRQWLYHAYDLARSYRRFDLLLDRGDVGFVSFRRMTTEVDYLTSVLRAYGVDDVEPTEADLAEPVNPSRTYRFSRDDVPAWCALPLRAVGYMIDKYGL